MAVLVGVGDITGDFGLYDKVKLFIEVSSCSPFSTLQPRTNIKGVKQQRGHSSDGVPATFQ